MTITRYFDAFNQGDTFAMESLVSDNFEHHVNEGRVRTGVEAFREFNAHMTRCYREQLVDLVILANDQGTRAAAEFIVKGVYLDTDGNLPPARGQHYALPAGSFFTLQGDKITRLTTYYNLADWLAQVS
jgi:steroid delta-isomerase-like uncharacterized protein